GDQIVNEGGEKHRLAGARKPGHAEAQGAAGKVIADRTGDEFGLKEKIAETWQGPIRARNRRAYLGGGRRFGQWALPSGPWLARHFAGFNWQRLRRENVGHCTRATQIFDGATRRRRF